HIHVCKRPVQIIRQPIVSRAPPLQCKISDDSSCRKYNTGITILFATTKTNGRTGDTHPRPLTLNSGVNTGITGFFVIALDNYKSGWTLLTPDVDYINCSALSG
ncbi:MAG: hypothetical protein WAL29_18075, partial [Bacteroidales bacterium]